MQSKIKWITYTALFIALLIAVQMVTKPAGQFVTGSLVNFIMLLATLTAGFASGLTVAALSPFFAFLVGAGPAFPQLLPVVALGNIVLVVTVHYIGGRQNRKALLAGGIVAAAVLKFLVLWVGIVQLVLPTMTQLKPPQLQLLSATFSWPQLVTALIGGGLCWLVAPTLRNKLAQTRAAD